MCTKDTNPNPGFTDSESTKYMKFIPMVLTTPGPNGDRRGLTSDMFQDGVLPQVGDTVELYVFARHDDENSTQVSVKFRTKKST